MNDKVKEYIELKLTGCVDSKPLLAAKYKEEIKGTIGEFIRKKLGLTLSDYEKIKEDNDDEIQRIKALYNNEERKSGFETIYKFYDWYKKQAPSCCYCGVNAKDLDKYFHENNKQYMNARQRGRVLEIERVITAVKEHNVYTAENCRLACYICNNAKSDFLSPKDFMPIAIGISNFWISKNVQVEFPNNSDIWTLDIKE